MKGMTNVAEDDNILTLEEASELFKVSTKTFLKMLREEDLPARKIGREWRFSKQALLEWMARGQSQEYVQAENQVKEYFNQVAPQYNEQRSRCYGQALRDIILAQVEIGSRENVADIGAGTGYLALELAKKAGKVLAVDNSSQMLAIAKEEAVKAGLRNIEFLEGDAADLPLPAKSVNLVVANMLLHHVNDPLQVIREMYRILKPEGRIVITDSEEHQHNWLRQEKSDLWLGFGREELMEWFKTAGFKGILVKDAGCDCCTGTSDGSKTVKIKILLAVGKR